MKYVVIEEYHDNGSTHFYYKRWDRTPIVESFIGQHADVYRTLVDSKAEAIGMVEAFKDSV